MEGLSFTEEPKTRVVKSKLLIQDEGSEDEEGKEVPVTAFSRTEGAVPSKPKPKKEPLVIKPESNENWREEVRRRTYDLPPKRESREGLEYGLNEIEKEEYYDDNEEELPRLTEQQAYHRDLDERPEAPNAETYKKMSVDDFGPALLRGLGMDPAQEPGQNQNQNNKDNKDNVKLRPALLGLGAKDLRAENEQELGAWGKSATRKQKQVEKRYVPVQKVNKSTGAVVRSDDDVKERDDGRKTDRSESSRHESQRDISPGRRDKDRGKSDRSRRYERDRKSRDRDRRGDRERSRRHRHRDDDKARNRDSRRYRDRDGEERR